VPSAQNAFKGVPVFGLADYDPDGVSILSVYRRGSASMPHENANLVVPHLRWVAMKSAHVVSSDAASEYSALMRLSDRDRRRANSQLGKCVARSEPQEREVLRELQVMLMLNVKAELQAVEGGSDGLCDLVAAELGVEEL
jgi:meiotic recombination protein SPO11